MHSLIAAACLTAGLTSAPATGPGDGFSKSVQGRATTLTRALDHRIHFNEAQYVRVKHLHLEYLNERHELELSLAGAPAADRDAQLAAAQLRYETSLHALLTSDQRLAYQNLRQSFTAHRL